MSIEFELYRSEDDKMNDPGKEKRDKLKNRLEQIRKEHDKNMIALSKLIDVAENGNLDYLYVNCPILAKKMSKTATLTGMIPAEFGIKEKKEYISRVAATKKSIQVTQTEDELHIILPELLPHRPQYDSSTGKIRYFYDVDKWRTDYYSALSAEFMRGKYRLMDVKACMIFLNHVRGSESADVDNFEYKVITDLVTLFVLVDDSHRCLSQYMDVVEDDENYTEIIVCPLKRIGDYLDIG